MTPKDRHLLRMLRDEGVTITRLAAGFGMTKQGVSWALNYQPRPALYLTEEEKKARVKRWAENTYRRKCGLTARRKI